MTFKKGQSGNPAGRPKTWAEFRRMCQELSPDMIRRLASVANAEPQTRLYTKTLPSGAQRVVRETFTPGLQYQIDAADKILDRAYGKPAQPVTGEDGEGPVRIAGQIEQIVVHVRHDLVDEDGNAKQKTIEHDPQEGPRRRGNGSGR